MAPATLQLQLPCARCTSLRVPGSSGNPILRPAPRLPVCAARVHLFHNSTPRRLSFPIARPCIVFKSSITRAAAASDGDNAEITYPSLADAPLLPFLDLATGAPLPLPSSSGVYAIHDKDGVLQYMGIGRRLSASLAVHLRELPDLCSSVKILEVSSPERSALVNAWQQWVQEHITATGTPPPGNEPGNTLWTTRKRISKPEIRLTPGNNKELTCSIRDLVDMVVKEHKVVVFVKGTRTEPQCGFSHRVLSILNETGVDYEVLNVLDENHNPGLREVIKEYSQWPTIPQIFVGGEFVGGADILDEMAQSGELKELLAKVQTPAKAST